MQEQRLSLSDQECLNRASLAGRTVFARTLFFGRWRGGCVLGGHVGVIVRLGASDVLLKIVVVAVRDDIDIVADKAALLVVAAGRNLLLEHHIVGVDLARVCKDDRHLLERTTSRLGEDEVGHHQDDKVEHRKHRVRVVRDALEHDRSHHDHHEVEQPVCRSADTIRLGSNGKRGNLGRVQPRHAKPAPGKTGVKEEVEDHRNDAGRAALVFDRRGVHDGEDDHADDLTGGATEHEGATTHSFDKQDGGPGSDEVLGTVGGGENTGVDVGEAELFLQSLADVVGDEIDSTNLLEHLRDEAKDGTVEVTFRAVSEQVPDPGGLGRDERGGDFAKLLVNKGVVDGYVVESGNDLSCIVFTAFEQEPTGRLGKEDGDESREDENKLESDGRSPSSRARINEEECKVDPVGHSDTSRNHGAFDHDEHASFVGRRAFTLPDRDRSGVHTVSDAEDNTEDEELSQGVGSSASNGADGHDDGADPDVNPATEQITKIEHRDCTDKAAELVDTSDKALEDGGFRSCLLASSVDAWELLVPRRKCVK